MQEIYADTFVFDVMGYFTGNFAKRLRKYHCGEKLCG